MKRKLENKNQPIEIHTTKNTHVRDDDSSFLLQCNPYITEVEEIPTHDPLTSSSHASPVKTLQRVQSLNSAVPERNHDVASQPPKASKPTVVYDGKRTRKPVARKTIDFNSSIIRHLQDRIFYRNANEVRREKKGGRKISTQLCLCLCLNDMTSCRLPSFSPLPTAHET